MILTLDPTSALPPFEQLRIQVIDAVLSGRLAAGAKLPTVRRLAEDLGIATNTVARSYRELERAGYIETRGRNGSIVASRGDNPAAGETRRRYVRTPRLGVGDFCPGSTGPGANCVTDSTGGELNAEAYVRIKHRTRERQPSPPRAAGSRSRSPTGRSRPATPVTFQQDLVRNQRLSCGRPQLARMIALPLVRRERPHQPPADHLGSVNLAHGRRRGRPALVREPELSVEHLARTHQNSEPRR